MDTYKFGSQAQTTSSKRALFPTTNLKRLVNIALLNLFFFAHFHFP